VGALTDRSARPGRLFVIGLSTLAATQLALAACVGRVFLAVPILVALLAGVVSPLVTGGLTSLLPELAGDQTALLRAQAFDSATYNTAAILAPLGAAALSAVASPTAAIVVFAGLAALSAALVGRLAVRGRAEPANRPGIWAALRAGTALMWRSRRLGAVTLATTGSYLGIGALPLTLALYATALGQPANRGGFLYATFALGTLATSLVLGAFPPRRIRPETFVLGGLAACGTVLALTGLWLTALPAAVLAMLVAGVAEGPVLGMTFAVRGQESPDGLRTQVFVTAASLKITAAAVGSALAGTAAVAGGRHLLLGTGALQLLAAGAGLVVLAVRRSSGSAAAGLADHPPAAD
jgi:MFS family permease